MLLDNSNKKLSIIQEADFTNERELQHLCEQNLQLLLNLEFVATEFTVANFRIDTLAYDKEAKAFIIIEYKNKKISSVVDQGYSYLSIMLNHKADFVLEYSKKIGKVHAINDINWAQSKIIFVSPHFTQYQMGAINFKDLPIELWKIKKFTNNAISFEQITAMNATAKISEVVPIQSNQNAELIKEIKEIKTYSEEDLVAISNEDIQELYSTIKEFILNENEEIQVKATKLYVGFYKNRSPQISIKLYKASLVLWINEKFINIDDPKHIVKDMSNIGHHGVGECQIQITDDSNIGYIQDLIRKHLSDKG